MKALTLVVLMGLAGCAHAPLDTAEIESKALDARMRVNELAESLTETKTPILMFCGLVGEDDAKCEALRTGYEIGRQAIGSTQRYIDAFAQTGQGLAVVEAGLSVIEAAVQEVRAETDRLIEEVKHELVGADIGPSGRPGDVAGEPPEVEAGGEVAEGEGSAAAIEQHDAEGQGANAQAEGAGSAGERAPAGRSDTGGEAEQGQ